MRFAARIALEHQPTASWQELVFSETNLQSRLTGLLALTRVGSPELKPRLLEALNALSWNTLSREQQLDYLRVYSLTFIRMGEPSDPEREAALATLNPLFPTQDRFQNVELCQLLCYLQSPEAAAKSVLLLKVLPVRKNKSITPNPCDCSALVGLKICRSVTFPGLSKRLLSRGGELRKFVDAIKNDVSMLNDGQKVAMKDIMEAEPSIQSPLEAIAARSFVKEWSASSCSAR